MDVQDVLKESITYEDEWQAEKTNSLPDPEQATSLSYSSAEVCIFTYLFTYLHRRRRHRSVHGGP